VAEKGGSKGWPKGMAEGGAEEAILGGKEGDKKKERLSINRWYLPFSF